ncbi:MAG: hypothetical protein A2270_03045 [Elusimicrobia bacterium RIFOXYA12_FULL_51_18]|nr:MAG: hypothetical protein A2270_03045 [Elusimicrobia bacterium RIFOXYA12_FULL_51_18]OGS28377.1 MAG: hypothetical protein A2218_06845 [Elusimicrobia bacterium RIFOXYA2_FULL_53_38]
MESSDFYALASPNIFDPTIFLSAKSDEQKVCGFVLMLSLVHNDLHDLLWAFALHHKNPPSTPKGFTAEWGNYNGLQSHILRLILANFRETLYFIKGHEREINHPMFQDAIRHLSKQDKECWGDLVAAASGNTEGAQTKFRNFLNTIRNKIASHYAGLDEIAQGYRHKFFDEQGKKCMEAFISRGDSMSATRFYFADAAAQGVIEMGVKKNQDEFQKANSAYASNINRAIYSIVDRFIQVSRKAAYSQPK